MIRFSGFMAFVLTTLSASLMAQTEARITTMHMQQGNPAGQFTVAIRCNGESQFDLQKSQMVVTDNGMPVTDFDIIESSSPVLRNLFSAVLVMDASGSMTGSGNAGAKAAGTAFVDFMDGSIDEAALLWFNQSVTTYQQMTTVKPMLLAAVASLPASGSTAMFDAAYAGLLELQLNGLNPKKAVLLLSDGGDNSSSRTPAEVISLANRLNLRIFTVGLGGLLDTLSLHYMASLTGGLYYTTPDPGALQAIFTEIANFMGRGFEEHTVAFTSPDPDAATHELRISVVACGETAAATKQEVALNTTGMRQLREAAPFALTLGQCIPNPVASGSEAMLTYSLDGIDAPQPLRLEVFDILGRRVGKLLDADVPPGAHVARFDTRGLARGIYLYRLSSGGIVTTRSMIVR
jgi:hypothetical protein